MEWFDQAYTGYVLTAYSLTGICLFGLFGWLLWQKKAYLSQLKQLETQGENSS